MTQRWVRLTMALTVAAIWLAAGIMTVRLDRSHADTLQARHAFDDTARTMLVLVGDLSGAVRSYVATGQEGRLWHSRVAALLERLADDVPRLRETAVADPARGALDASAGVIEDFRRLDAQVRDRIGDGQTLAASDVIFSDALRLTASLTQQIDLARNVEAVRADQALAAAGHERLAWLLGAAGSALVALVLLVPLPRRTMPARIARSTGEAGADGDELYLRPPSDELPAAPARAPDLQATARLCTDLARVLETTELTGLLGQAAQLLGARGLVLWTSDRSGSELRPSLAHGYPPETLAHLGVIASDSHNATAAAFRQGELTVVASEPGGSGAIVAPIVSPAGCLGVLAIEVPAGAEQSDAARAVAAIVAAQLSTLVSAVPAGTSVAHAQA